MKNFVESEKKCLLEKHSNHQRNTIINYLLNAFIFTPLVIIYWCATWNVFYLAIFYQNILLSCSITFLISNFILLIVYQLQEPLENLNSSLPSNSWVAKILRFCFSYTMSIAYVSQWRTYWDIYNYYSTMIHFKYTVLLSMMALICFRVFLDRKLTPLIKCVPFHLEPSQDLSNFFTQPKIFSLKSRMAQNLVNFVYMEFVEMLINVFIWKGIWDVFELGVKHYTFVYFGEQTHFLSILQTCLFGYFIFFVALVVLVLVKKYDLKTKEIFKTCFELICFIGLVALWRSFFALFDFYVLKSDFKLEMSCTTHALLFTFMYLIGLISALNGPAGFEAESDRQKEPNLKFNISYFS